MVMVDQHVDTTRTAPIAANCGAGLSCRISELRKLSTRVISESRRITCTAKGKGGKPEQRSPKEGMSNRSCVLKSGLLLARLMINVGTPAPLQPSPVTLALANTRTANQIVSNHSVDIQTVWWGTIFLPEERRGL